MSDKTDNTLCFYKIFILGSLEDFDNEEFEEQVNLLFREYFSEYYKNSVSEVCKSSSSENNTNLLQIKHNLSSDIKDYSRASVIILMINDHFKNNEQIELLNKLTKENIPIITLTDDIKHYAEYTEFNERIKLTNAIDITRNEERLQLPYTVLKSLGLEDRYRKVFISYARKDKTKLAYTLFYELQKYHYEVFLDFLSIDKATSFQDELKQQLCDSDVLIMLDSKHYRESKWVNEEVQLAFQRNIPMLLLKSDSSGVNNKDITQENGFERLVENIFIDYKKSSNENGFDPISIFEGSEDNLCVIDKKNLTKIVLACERLRSLGFARRSQAIFSAGYSYLKTLKIPELNKNKGSLKCEFSFKNIMIKYGKQVSLCVAPIIKLPKFSNLIYEPVLLNFIPDKRNIVKRYLFLFDKFGLTKLYDNAFLTSYYSNTGCDVGNKLSSLKNKSSEDREVNCRILLYPIDDIFSHNGYLPFFKKNKSHSEGLNSQVGTHLSPSLTNCSESRAFSSMDIYESIAHEVPSQRFNNYSSSDLIPSDLPLLFLSASLPGNNVNKNFLSDKDRAYTNTIDKYLILFAVRELIKVCANKYKIIFGGHPQISYLIADTINKISLDRPLNELFTVYQSKFFKSQYPYINEFFSSSSAIVYTSESMDEFFNYNTENFSINLAKNQSTYSIIRDENLRKMRHEMIDQNIFSKAVFIGGKSGVKEEFSILVSSLNQYNSPCEILSLSSPGGAAATFTRPSVCEKSQHTFVSYEGFDFRAFWDNHLLNNYSADCYFEPQTRASSYGYLHQSDIPRDHGKYEAPTDSEQDNSIKQDHFIRQLRKFLK